MFTYDSLGSIIGQTMPGNIAVRSISTVYSFTTDVIYSQSAALGQPLLVTNNLGHATHAPYDLQGDVASQTDAVGNAISMTYNLASQPVSMTFPATGETGTGQSYSYSVYLYPGGPLASTKLYDESGSLVREIDYTHGGEGELLSFSGSTESVAYAYDALYRKIALYDGNGNETQYSYNTAGYLAQTTYPGHSGSGHGDTTQFTLYNNSGQLLQRIDGNGVTTNFVYGDADGLLSAVQYPATTALNVSLSYDSYGRCNGKTDATGSFTYSYDDRNVLTSTVTTYSGFSALTVSRAYYADGSVASVTTPAGTYAFDYDGAGRMTSLTNPYSETTAWSYLNNNWLSSQGLANGALATFSYNALGQMTALANMLSSNTLSQFSNMNYDATGNRVAVTASLASVSSLSGNIAYTYDSKDRLLSEVSGLSGGFTNCFASDTAGNPTTFRGSSRSYNSDNQLSATGFGYDGNGNPTTYNGTGVTFDANNKATAFGSVMAAGYRADGLRAWKQNGGTSAYTYFLYDGGVPILEINGSGTVTAVNTWGPNGLISRYSGGSSVFYNFDERGNTAQRMNGSGTVLSYRASDSFGATSGSLATGDPYDGFGAQWGYYGDSETGLTLCGQRYYDPNTGRWVTRDPIGYRGGVNIYNYCSNRPVIQVDPIGLASLNVIGFPNFHEFIDVKCSFSNPGTHSFGFWPTGWSPINPFAPGTIQNGDPHEGDGTPVDTGNDPVFVDALCTCIADSINDHPAYVFGSYVCYNWAHDVWDCHKQEKFSQAKELRASLLA